MLPHNFMSSTVSDPVLNQFLRQRRTSAIFFPSPESNFLFFFLFFAPLSASGLTLACSFSQVFLNLN